MAITNWYVDTLLATGANDGTSPTDAWQNLQTALQYNAFNAANVNLIWIRRTSSHTMISDIVLGDNGAASLPIIFIGFPRAAITSATITQADFTLGSTTVDNIVGITCDREKHQGRYITAPNGYRFLITRVVDTNTIIIDSEYTGATVTGTDGAFQIDADNFYSDRPAAAISAGWDSDAIDLIQMDGNSANYAFTINFHFFYGFVHFEFLNFADVTWGTMQITNARKVILEGCLFKSSADENMLTITGDSFLFMVRTIFEGTGAGTNQRGINATAGRAWIKDVAIYNMGDNGIGVGGAGMDFYFDNVNIGVEVANGDDDIRTYDPGIIRARNLKLGGSNGYVSLEDIDSYIYVENYQKVLGDNKSWFSGGEYLSTAVTGETPNKKLSDIVLKITPDNNFLDFVYYVDEWRVRIPLGVIDMDSGSQTVKLWLYNDLGATLNSGDPEADVFLEAEYIDSYNDTTAYTRARVKSTEQDIAAAADADDWDYLSVSVNPAVASLVHFSLVVSLYNVNDFFIDPQVVIT